MKTRAIQLSRAGSYALAVKTGLLLLVVLLSGACGGATGSTSAPAQAGDEVTNAAGFAFVLPEGWKVAFNTTGDDGGAVSLVPEESFAHGVASIAIVFGSQSLLLPEEQQLEPDVAPALMLNAVLNTIRDAENQFTISEQTDIQVAGFAGQAVTWNSERSEGRYVLARTRAGYWFSMNGSAPPGLWDQVPFVAVLDSLRFFTPTE